MIAATRAVLVVLGVLMAVLLYGALSEDPEGDWQNVSGHSRGWFDESSDFKFCSRGLSDWVAIHEGSPEQIKCMRQRGWVWREYDSGNSGPANTGKAIFLFVIFPVLATFFVALLVVPQRFKKYVLYSLCALSALVGCWIAFVIFIVTFKTGVH